MSLLCLAWYEAVGVTAVIHQCRLINQKCQQHTVAMVTEGVGQLRSTSVLPCVLGYLMPMPISASQCQFELAGPYIIIEGLVIPKWQNSLKQLDGRKMKTVKHGHFHTNNMPCYKVIYILTWSVWILQLYMNQVLLLSHFFNRLELSVDLCVYALFNWNQQITREFDLIFLTL